MGKLPIAVLVAFCVAVCGLSTTRAADPPPAFRTLEGRHISLVTDLPPSPEVDSLPAVFDAAFDAWMELFKVDPVRAAAWRVKAHIMTDRSRFEAAGLLDSSTYDFREGHQVGDFIYCKEQPSDYYRRHLLLHEGVHWFMERALGGYGPKWWMEGTAEWLGTHRWEAGRYVGGVVPASREETPYWGRFAWTAQDIAGGEAPSLRQILFDIESVHRIDSIYAWSWMAVNFFANHPRYRDDFYSRLSQPTDGSRSLSDDVMGWIGPDLGLVQAEFNGFITAMSYGVDPAKAVPDLKAARGEPVAEASFAVDAGLLWQAMPIGPGTFRISAEGVVQLEEHPFVLESHPQGITLRYVDGQPLGRLLAAVAKVDDSEGRSEPWKPLPLGRGGEFQLKRGEILLLKVNDDAASIADNTGAYRVRSEPVR